MLSEKQSVIQLAQKVVQNTPGLTSKEVANRVSQIRPDRVDVVNRALERLSLKGEINRIKSTKGVITNHPKPEQFGITRTMAFFNKTLLEVRNKYKFELEKCIGS
ncbi:hypothetical protein [Yersinia enterocolitica]|uniref:hypothetical protein n=1 Tax=Yersinia enterocolitica TaxID=630 RepID=UPI0005E74A0F|nr:hypothetical protein [Yersinia enterocolitica]CNH51904.1 Uncharacterised protein [Yersinia enterocolitica]